MGCDSTGCAPASTSADFNPRTHVGCDRYIVTFYHNIKNFNPRTHVGCDQVRQSLDFGLLISIHAPTWGATPAEHPLHVRADISIHAPTWGATPAIKFSLQLLLYFNPRTHVGCDNLQATAKYPLYISIHAPTWGATCCIRLSLYQSLYFNPRTHVGCDFHVFCSSDYSFISIHAPTWGATVKPSNGWLLGHKDNEFANENIIIINSVNIT